MDMHCALLQGGELQAVVGDASRNGVGGTQYCGLWSLTSIHRVFNAFGNSYAGLIPGELRSKAPRLRQVADDTVELWRCADEQWPSDATASYRLVPPYTIEHELRVTDRRDVRVPGAGYDFREISWCCYMNCPADSRIHYLSGGEWHRYLSPQHGVGSRMAPNYLSADVIERLPADSKSFHMHWYTRGFDAPFYYGRLGNMVLILVFDQPRQLRFFMSPSGGGGSLRAEALPGELPSFRDPSVATHPEWHCPAWDFLWVIPAAEYHPEREYRFRMRLIYKRYESDDDVLAEVRQAQAAAGFEPVQSRTFQVPRP